MWCNSRGRDPERLVGKQCVLGTTGVESLACAHPGPPRGGELAWSAPTQVTRSWEEARMQTHAPSGRTDSDGRAHSQASSPATCTDGRALAYRAPCVLPHTP